MVEDNVVFEAKTANVDGNGLMSLGEMGRIEASARVR
jgi:hypothetical protein